MPNYKRDKRVRPVLIKSICPSEAKAFTKNYVGMEAISVSPFPVGNYHVFEFTNKNEMRTFLDVVGGAIHPLGGGIRAILAEKSPELFESLRESRKISKLDEDMQVFRDLDFYLSEMLKQKAQFFTFLGVTENERALFKLVWEKEWWKAKYFQEKNKSAK